jgi:hypothetical protein
MYIFKNIYIYIYIYIFIYFASLKKKFIFAPLSPKSLDPRGSIINYIISVSFVRNYGPKSP